MKLTTITLQQETNVPAKQPMNRIVVVDVSGSMYNELPKLRTHLKNKIPTLIEDDDTLTIIWFSGKNQAGILFEGIKVNTLQDLTQVNTSIDRFLTPQGMTGFVEPLNLVSEVCNRLTGDSTLFFMTDGGENVSSKKSVIQTCSEISDKIASVAFVEYGYYADHKMLMDMAEEVSGEVILAENFQSYTESLNKSMKSNTSGKKIKVQNIKASFVIGNTDSGFVIAKPDAVGTVTLPSNTISYSFLSGTGDIDEIDGDVTQSVFSVAALIQRGEADKALQVASLIGDVPLYKQVENSFSKQDYAATCDLVSEYGTGTKKLYSSEPKKTNLIPDENAYNVLTLLMDLSEQEGNYLDISHPEFVYSSIGSKRETAETTDGFKPVFKDKTDSVKAPITSLAFDEDRPNISIKVKREGTVTLPKNEFGFGESFDSFIFRNYAIVKDGIINVRKLPVVLSKATHDLFTQLNVINEPFKVGKTYVIDTKQFPIINRSMATPVKSTDLFTRQMVLYTLKVKQKILNSEIEKPEVSEKFAALYGEEGAKFLSDLGIKEGGFSPKTVKGEQLDPYVSKVLEVSLSGLSTIPKVDDVKKAIAANKNLTPSQKVVSMVLDELALIKDKVSELKKTKKLIKEITNEIVKIKFGVILGKKWFTDMVSLDDNVRELDFGLGKKIKCTVSLTDKEI